MKKLIAEKVKGLLTQGKIKGFVALKQNGEHIAPYVFTDPEELKDLSTGDRKKPGDARYPLVKLLCRMVGLFPGERFGIMVRGCDERAVLQLMRDSRVANLHPDRIVFIGFACPAELAEECQCHKPWPDALAAGDPVSGVNVDPADESDDPMVELQNWYAVFDRCLKCFGCRNSCPVCDCKECSMEVEALVPQRELPVGQNFLMTRAVHMVDRCVYCGLCELACPANIPLKSLYRLVARVMGKGDSLPEAVEAPVGDKAAEAFADADAQEQQAAVQ